MHSLLFKNEHDFFSIEDNNSIAPLPIQKDIARMQKQLNEQEETILSFLTDNQAKALEQMRNLSNEYLMMKFSTINDRNLAANKFHKKIFKIINNNDLINATFWRTNSLYLQLMKLNPIDTVDEVSYMALIAYINTLPTELQQNSIILDNHLISSSNFMDILDYIKKVGIETLISLLTENLKTITQDIKILTENLKTINQDIKILAENLKTITQDEDNYFTQESFKDQIDHSEILDQETETASYDYC